MGDRTLDQWAKQHREIIAQEQNSAIATAVTSARQNSIVQAKLETSLPGQPNPMSAIAWNECSEGQQIFLFRPDGESKWYAIGAGAAQVVETRVVQNVHRREQPATATGPIKVLFSTVTDGIRNFYVGGDRSNPSKLAFTLPATTPVEAHLANTGRRNANWIVTFRWQEGNTTKLKLLSGDQTIDAEQSVSMAYRGGGFWASGLTIPDWYEAEREEQGSDSSGGSYYRRYVDGVLIENQFQQGIPTVVTFQNTVDVDYASDPLASGSGSFHRIEQGTIDLGFGVGDAPKDITKSETDQKNGLTVSAKFDKSGYELVFGTYASDRSYGQAEFLEYANNFTDQFSSLEFGENSLESYTGSIHLSGSISKIASSEIGLQQEGSTSSSPSPNGGQNVISISSKNEMIQQEFFYSLLAGLNSAIFNRQATEETRNFVNNQYVGGNSVTENDVFLVIKTEEETTQIKIASNQLPQLFNYQTTNLIGDRILVAPIDPEYRNKDKKGEIELSVIQQDGAVVATTKQAKIFNLRSPNCQIHSASAFL